MSSFLKVAGAANLSHEPRGTRLRLHERKSAQRWWLSMLLGITSSEDEPPA